MNPNPRLGVFDALLAVGGRPVALHAHLARMAGSVAHLYGRSEPPTDDVRLVSGAASNPHRIRVTARPGPTAVEWRIESESVRRTFLDPHSERGWSLFAVGSQSGLGSHKWCDRAPLNELTGKAEADHDDVLLIDRTGLVLEGGRTNVFAVVGAELVTPPSDGRILPGIARGAVVELARVSGVRVRVCPVAAADLQRAAEVFVTNSILGIEPVSCCSGALRAEWRPGPLGAHLRSALAAHWLERAEDEPRAS